MPTLIETIIDYEPDLLGIIAEQWGIDQDLNVSKNQARQIADRLINESLFNEVFNALPQAAYNALIRLVRSNGRMPLDQFEREFGSLREMGAARREKLRPDRNPASITESLFYKALVARAFLREGSQPQEFIYLPDEFFLYLTHKVSELDTASIPTLPAYSPQRIFPADDGILEHVCILLAGLRTGMNLDLLVLEKPKISIPFLLSLLVEMDLVSAENLPNPQKIGSFLEAPRSQSFSALVQAWQTSTRVNESGLLSGLDFEVGIKMNPKVIRKKLLTFLEHLPAEQWFDMTEFIAWLKTIQPDFLRTGGEYESWIIRDTTTGQFLKGFENWDRVEGAWLKTMIQGPFFWMGLMDLGSKTKTGKPDLFRRSKWALDLINGKIPGYENSKAQTFTINKNGLILLERSFPLSPHYQIARFCDWGPSKKGQYTYQISHPALQKALQQGLQINQFITLINKYGKKPIPPNIPQALERWRENQLEAVFERPVLLRVRSAVILDQLLASRASSTIVTRLNDTTAIVKTGSVGQLKEVLLDMGILADVRLEV
jgi:hypothetical protein